MYIYIYMHICIYICVYMYIHLYIYRANTKLTLVKDYVLLKKGKGIIQKEIFIFIRLLKSLGGVGSASSAFKSALDTAEH